MKNNMISVLAAAAISIGIGFAATSSATAAPVMDEMQALAHADTKLALRIPGLDNGKWRRIKAYNRNDTIGKKKPTIRLNPKVCYERQRVGPKQYVIVKRAC